MEVCVVIPKRIQKQAVEQLYINYIGIEKTRLLACKSIYWTGMNSDIEKKKNI